MALLLLSLHLPCARDDELAMRRRHSDVCASSHHQSISNQTFRSTGKTPTETFLNDVGLELGRAELRFWLIDLFGISGKRGTRRRGILIGL
uniref:Secreted protein n=1 Tax=Brassica oleracea var. oleracea TaxID=109376 RepID=A0A0D3BK39_BRAOL